MSRIWSKFKVKVGTWSSPEKVEWLLERTGRIALDVEIDTESVGMARISEPCQYICAVEESDDLFISEGGEAAGNRHPECPLPFTGHWRVLRASE